MLILNSPSTTSTFPSFSFPGNFVSLSALLVLNGVLSQICLCHLGSDFFNTLLEDGISVQWRATKLRKKDAKMGLDSKLQVCLLYCKAAKVVGEICHVEERAGVFCSGQFAAIIGVGYTALSSKSATAETIVQPEKK